MSSSGADRTPEQMVRLLAGFEVSQALYAFTKLDIATVMHGGVRAVDEIARRVEVDETALKRLLRTLTGVGVVEQRGEIEFAITDFGATLADGTEGSLRDMALMLMETHYRPFERFVDTVRTGEPAFDIHYGQSFFEWVTAEPERAELVSAGMASMTDSVQGDVFAGYRLPDGDLVADIGGADGSVLTRLIRDEPARRGIVFDLPEVVSAAATRVSEAAVVGRISLVGGDFFDGVPAADVYVLSTVLHDWDDASCGVLLGRIVAAARPGARLVLVETIMPVTNEPHFSKQSDLTMLGMVRGRERTLAEFTDVLAAAGFVVDRLVPTPPTSPYGIVEATLAP
ncbi:methyltransferase [Saccharomonospora sp. CUA-673]|uniref:methyltransferase n=1 Tax=Saccharomonospora sp. CUA-673 TaxID=1904969 RepID=UPI001300DD90|nr:methyltransferase [Saccharomonospora sp. CUA-673]